MAKEIDKQTKQFDQIQNKKGNIDSGKQHSVEVTSQSSRKKEDSVRVRDNLLHHVVKSGFKEGFNQIVEEEESKQETQTKQTERDSREKHLAAQNTHNIDN